MRVAKGISLRTLAIFLVVLLLVLGFGYKTLEWAFFNKLSRIHSSTVSEELSLISSANETYREGELVFEELEENLDGDVEDATNSISSTIGHMNLLENQSREYIKVNEKNRDRYDKLEFFAKFIVGKRGQVARDFLDTTSRYYELELQISKENQVYSVFYKNFLSALEDMVILTEFFKEAAESPNMEAYIGDNFGELVTLEKYSRDDFVFEEEQKIKEQYKYGHEVLTNWHDYMASVYLFAKDYASGDLESAAYKYDVLVKKEVSIEFDFDRIFEERDSLLRERAETQLANALKRVDLIKDYKEANYGRYPLLPEINSWKEDLELCQLYEYKTSLYESVIGEYPESQDFESLLSELNRISPKTGELDSNFERNMLEFKNSEEEIVFTCTDQKDGTSYTFLILK